MSITTCSATPRRAEPRRLPPWLMLLLVGWLVAPLPVQAGATAGASATTTAAVPLPSALAARSVAWQPRGSGTLTWLGFDVYVATLWAAPGAAISPGTDFSLAIRYQRSIPARRLVDTTLSEMRRLGVAEEATVAGWRNTLATVFPDVSPGDTIVGVNESGERVVFYHGERRTGVIEDAAFARAFFAIWLDARTREPGLRAQLLGDGGGQDG